VAALYHLK